MRTVQIILLIISLTSLNLILSGQCITVMSYNIRYDNYNDGENRWDMRKASMIEMIEQYHPEIIGIQEGLLHQVQFLDSNLRSYKYIGVGRDDGINKGEFSAILYDTTKFSALISSTFWLSGTPGSVSVGWDASMERICTYGLFLQNESKQKIWVFNTHFDHMGKLSREKSAKLILKTIRKINRKGLPVILMGDLNSLPESQAIKIINRKLSDAYLLSENPPEPKGTYNGFNPENTLDKRIDYIFLSGFEVELFKHINDRRKDNYFISDHLPVFAKLKVLY